MKWIWVIVLVIIGVLATIVAIEYLTVSIGALPSWIPGQKHHAHGHYHKRGAAAAVIAIVAYVIAGYLTFRNLRTQPAGPSAPTPGAEPPPAPGSADQLLSGPGPQPGPPLSGPGPQPGPPENQ